MSSPPSFPPDCDAACRAKILLNSGTVASEAMNSRNLAIHLADNGLLKGKHAQQLIDIYDEFEDKILEWNKRRLEETGYKRKTKKFVLEEV